MRFLCLVLTAAVSSSLAAACSNAVDSPIHRTSRPAAAQSPGGGAPSSAASSPAASTPQPPHAAGDPPAAPATPTSTARPSRTNVCENPTCTFGRGACGCTAKDTQGVTVTMDCQGGVCECVTGNQITTDFGDENCATDGDARTLYSANCGCL